MSSPAQVRPSPSPSRDARRGVGWLGALAVAADAVDDVVLSTVRDVHTAVADRVFGTTGRFTGGTSQLPGAVHRTVSTAVYAGLGTGLQAASRGLKAADRGVGQRIEDFPRGRFLVAAVNGLIGDRLAEEHSEMAIELAVRRDGRDVPLQREALADAFPQAGPDLVVFLHGLGETEELWDRGAGPGYGDRLAEESTWTPVFLRANTGLRITENAVAVASLLDRLVQHWPTDVRRIALVGHSMGGLVFRAACAVATDAETPWTDLVTNVVTLGSPHLGAPLERSVAKGASVLGWLPESAPFGRILEHRSVGILDLRAGLAPDVANLPRARYHLVAATLGSTPGHPLSAVLGDLLVRYPSAVGRPRRGAQLFPDADELHIHGSHFDLLNHPDVYRALRGWLA